MKSFQKRKLSEICAKALIAGGVAVTMLPLAYAAGTAAGTLIRNLATVTYQDTNGNSYSAQSNEAVITVKQVYSAEIASDNTKTAAAGQTIYSAHTLTNTGNGEDTYTLTVADANTLETQGIDPDSIAIYRDLNGNGIVDAGEPLVGNGTTGTLTLTGGETAELVVAVAVPNTAVPGDQIGIELLATSSNSTVVDMTSGSGGMDAAEGTNNTLITVSNDAVLNANKTAEAGPGANQITYTITVTNTGNKAATNVHIFDGLPKDTTLVSATAYGLLTSNSDTLPGSSAVALDEASGALNADLNADGDITDSTETGFGMDLNSDGVIDGTAVTGVHAIDVSLGAGQTVSLQFVVEYDPATYNNNSIPGSAGDVIKNVGHVTGLVDPGKPPVTTPTNPTGTVIPVSYGVDTSDTGNNVNDALNDGRDDDELNNTQLVNSAPSGSEVLFFVDISNLGNASDTMDLSISGSTFPAGTSFTFWNADGTVQLVDTNGKAGPDTGVLAPADPVLTTDSRTILVKAKLPAGATGSDMTATLTATSTNAPTGAAGSTDTTELKLLSISAPGADLTDNKDGATPSVNGDALDTPYALNNGGSIGTAGTRTTIAATVGSQVIIPFYIDNDSGASDSFQLSAGSVWDGSTLGGLPTGWTVQFYKGNGSGAPTGMPLTSTVLLPGETADAEYVAVITIPSDPAYALADYTADNNGDSTVDTLDSNGDGDGDQPIFIRISSANSGSSDIMLDAIDVTDLRSIVITPPGTNQIQPGGSVDYTHTLSNTGNTEETVELSAGNSASGWNNTVMVDTTGDGVPDTTLANLNPGDTVYGVDGTGTAVPMTVTDSDGDGLPEIAVPPGVNVDLVPTVFAPSNAAPGATDVLTITAENMDTDPAAPDAVLEDVTSVILGQVRLTKTVAYDALCDGTPDGAFQANLSTQVAPGECAIWQIVAENQGDANAMNVVIRDEVTAYTIFDTKGGADTNLQYALGSGTALAYMTQAAELSSTTDTADETNGTVTFYVGTGATSTAGGTLAPGEIATVRFRTQVE